MSQLQAPFRLGGSVARAVQAGIAEVSLPQTVVRMGDASAVLAGLVIVCALQGGLDPRWRLDPVRLGVLGALLAVLLPVMEAHAPRLAGLGKRGLARLAALGIPCGAALIVVAGVDHALGGGAALPAALYLMLAAAVPLLVVTTRGLASDLQALALRRGWLPRRGVLLLLHPARATAVEAYATDLPLHRVVEVHRLPQERGARRRLLAQLLPRAGAPGLDEVHLALPWQRWAHAQGIAGELGDIAIPVRLLADPDAPVPFGRRGGCRNELLFELRAPPLPDRARAAKRALDIVVAAVGLLVLAPLLAAVALAIRADSPGPALFRQARGGLNGRPFCIYKFRTMRVLEDGPAIAQAQRGDVRITAVGRWLRRTSIDELPQLLNVLRGEMSLIGPRPHALAHDVQYAAAIADYPLRHRVKPGLTGWAQVNGLRGETATIDTMMRRVDMDVWYARNSNFWLDLRILLKTVLSRSTYTSAF